MGVATPLSRRPVRTDDIPRRWHRHPEYLTCNDTFDEDVLRLVNFSWHFSSATTSLLRESAKLLDVLAQTLEVSLVVWALYEIHLSSKKLSLVGPLGVNDTLPMLGPPWLLLVIRGWLECTLVRWISCYRLWQILDRLNLGLRLGRSRFLAMGAWLLAGWTGRLALTATTDLGLALRFTSENRASG